MSSDVLDRNGLHRAYPTISPKASSLLIRSSHYFRMKTARSRVPGLSSPALVLESLNRFSPSLRLKVLKRKCQLCSPAVTLNRALVCVNYECLD